MRNFNFVRNNLGTLLMTGYPIFSVHKRNVFMYHNQPKCDQKSSSGQKCVSSSDIPTLVVVRNGISIWDKWYPKICNFDLQNKIDTLVMKVFFFSYIKKYQVLEVLRYHGLDVALSLPMYWTIDTAYHTFYLLG